MVLPGLRLAALCRLAAPAAQGVVPPLAAASPRAMPLPPRGSPSTPLTAISFHAKKQVRRSAGSWRTARRCAGGCPHAWSILLLLPPQGRRPPLRPLPTVIARSRKRTGRSGSVSSLMPPLPRLPLVLPAMMALPSSSRVASRTGRLSPRAPGLSPSPQRRPPRAAAWMARPRVLPLSMLMPRWVATSSEPRSHYGDGEAGDGGVHTPVWPPADASLAQLEDWLEALRRLPEDDVTLSRQVLLSRHIGDLRRPLPAPPAEPFVLKAT